MPLRGYGISTRSEHRFCASRNIRRRAIAVTFHREVHTVVRRWLLYGLPPRTLPHPHHFSPPLHARACGMRTALFAGGDAISLRLYRHMVSRTGSRTAAEDKVGVTRGVDDKRRGNTQDVICRHFVNKTVLHLSMHLSCFVWRHVRLLGTFHALPWPPPLLLSLRGRARFDPASRDGGRTAGAPFLFTCVGSLLRDAADEQASDGRWPAFHSRCFFGRGRRPLRLMPAMDIRRSPLKLMGVPRGSHNAFRGLDVRGTFAPRAAHLRTTSTRAGQHLTLRTTRETRYARWFADEPLQHWFYGYLRATAKPDACYLTLHHLHAVTHTAPHRGAATGSLLLSALMAL